MSGQDSKDPQGPDPRKVALVGFIIVVLLIVSGLILTHVLRNVSRLQDCVMSGRTNCAPVDSKASGG